MIKKEEDIRRSNLEIGLKYNNLISWLYKNYPEIVTEYEEEGNSNLVIYT